MHADNTELSVDTSLVECFRSRMRLFNVRKIAAFGFIITALKVVPSHADNHLVETRYLCTVERVSGYSIGYKGRFNDQRFRADKLWMVTITQDFQFTGDPTYITVTNARDRFDVYMQEWCSVLDDADKILCQSVGGSFLVSLAELRFVETNIRGYADGVLIGTPYISIGTCIPT